MSAKGAGVEMNHTQNFEFEHDEKLVLDGTKVKFLTQGRATLAKNQGGVITDYLRFTVLRERLFANRTLPESTLDTDICHLMAFKFASMLGFQVGQDRPGRDYYEHTTTIENEFGQEVGSVSGGGESQRDTFCFTLKGEGCTFALVGWEFRVHQFFDGFFPKITRIDLARDCFHYGDLSIEACVVAYEDHAFSYQNRKPKYIQHGCWLDGHSRTFQVGKRESGKLVRFYEKGHQFGMMDDQWVRAEVELRSVNRVIPWEALIKPGDYFAGAYEFCSWLVHQVQATKVKTQTKVAEVSVEACMRWVNRVVAPTLVHIAAAMPDMDWVEAIVSNNIQRPVPRSLKGLNSQHLGDAMTAIFKRVASFAAEPVKQLFNLVAVPGTVAMYSVNGIASPA